MSSDNALKVFGKILSFVNELKQVFPKPHIVKYYKLLKKTPASNPDAIQKHIQKFDLFLVQNREAILSKNQSSIEGDMSFSSSIFLDMKECILQADADTREVIFKHLQVLLFLIHPDKESKEAIQPLVASSGSSASSSAGAGGEEKFINDFMGRIEQSFSGEEFNDPMQATMKLLNSGIFTDMMSTVNKGLSSNELDVNRLIGTVQKMMGGIGQSTNDPQLNAMINMASNMMSNINSKIPSVPKPN